MGGSTLYVECTNVNGGPLLADGKENELTVGRVRSTGQLGDVMAESLSIAHSFSARFLNKYEHNNVTLQKDDLQLHVPEGATPKDGPSAGEYELLQRKVTVGCPRGGLGNLCCSCGSSCNSVVASCSDIAGITMATALLSLALDEPVIDNVAMTGELSLTGKVLKIGGVKEKVIAARRSDVEQIILPYANRKDWDELADSLVRVLFANAIHQPHKTISVAKARN